MNRKNIPKTDSIQELAHFWDTHDLTDFEDELEEVNEPIFELGTQLLVPLDPRELEALNALAKSRDTSPANLIREWLIERLEASSEPRT
ncbi:MAG: CopG family antitoxin [Candidatus Poribacteria bacterium]|nr:CopG family antitoxin [Candidatus Poribacteria bacterium]